jgi:hypothetical protein
MRIRTIKPEFWMHEGLCSKSDFTRLLAIALLNWADDEGYFMANPVLIRGQVFPFLDDSKIIPRSLLELSSVGWIELGKDDEGRDVGKIINFAKHQRVDKPKRSTIKDKARFQDASKNNLGLFQEASKEEGKGREEEGKRKGMEGKGAEVATAPVFPDSLNTPDFLKAWSDYIAYRSESKMKPLKPRSIDATIQELAGWGEASAITAIRETIRNGWQGIFAPKQGGGSNGRPAPRALSTDMTHEELVKRHGGTF